VDVGTSSAIDAQLLALRNPLFRWSLGLRRIAAYRPICADHGSALAGPRFRTRMRSWPGTDDGREFGVVGLRRRSLFAVLVLLLLLIAFWAMRRSLLAVLVLNGVFPVGPHPLDLVPPPSVRSISGMEADLYSPVWGGPHPALIIVNGAVDQGRKYPPLVGAAKALARAGYTVLVPELGKLREYIVGPEIVEDLVRSISLMHQQPEVTAGPVGLYGFSIGGSFALLAAEDSRAASSIAFVGDIGGYYRLTDMVQAVTTETIPNTARRVLLNRIVAFTLLNSLIEWLPPGPDRELLHDTLRRSQSTSPVAAFDNLKPEQLSDFGRPVLALIQNRDGTRVLPLVAALPPALQQLLKLSPESHLERIRARVWVLHDENDPFVPVEEARWLAEDPRLRGTVELSTTTLLKHTEFDLSKLTTDRLFGTYVPSLMRMERFVEETLAELPD
jgi:pimeloyl-ACP methyl ester carboxylesterase